MRGVKNTNPLFDLDSSFKSVPRAWLLYIEPKIRRPKASLCWEWTGGTDQHGEPMMSIQKVGSKSRTTIRVKRMVAGFFWALKNHYDVVHECGNLLCLNPWHFYISVVHASHENRDRMIRDKQKAIKDYLTRAKAPTRYIGTKEDGNGDSE